MKERNMKIRTIFISIVLFLSASIMLVSYGNQKVERREKIEFEDEINIIKNSEVHSVHVLKVIDKFGGLDVPKEKSFDNPVDMTISKKGLIYVLDSKDNNIKVFREVSQETHFIYKFKLPDSF